MSFLVPGYDFNECLDYICQLAPDLPSDLVKEILDSWLKYQKRVKMPPFVKGIPRRKNIIYLYEILDCDDDLIDEVLEKEMCYLYTLSAYSLIGSQNIPIRRSFSTHLRKS